jgi:hypothetical protein
MDPLTESLEPWKDQQWRQVARQFIGHALSPTAERPVPPDLLKLEIGNIKLTTPDPHEQNRRVYALNETQMNRQIADHLWYGWYQALSVWFPRPQPTGFTEYPFDTVVQSTVVAAILLLVITRSGDWMLWVGCLASFLIIALHQLQTAVHFVRYDTGLHYQLAGMLRELRSQSAPPSSVPAGGAAAGGS